VSGPGYFGHPVVKPPVWTWEVPLYFFVGGASGMSALIALTSLAGDATLELARAALWVALAGAVLSPGLLALDLGRPQRFLNMLRVIKLRSPMSVGAWALALFGLSTFASVVLFEGFAVLHQDLEIPKTVLSALLLASMTAAGATGTVLATYTGVLLGATAIPAWSSQRALLPVHFGAAGLGSAGALLELFGFDLPALTVIGFSAAGVETVLLFLIAAQPRGVRDRALHRGRPARLLRIAGVLTGPAALLLRLIGAWPLAALGFLAGALLSRYGWMAAGRASAEDTEAALMH
jgi:hypothetical protein